MSHQRLRALRASAVTTALAALLISGLAFAPVAPATAAAPALAQAAQLGAPSTGSTGGITIENSFVSAQGWVKPDDAYPSRVILTSTNSTPTPATVTLASPVGTEFTAATGPGTRDLTADLVTWTTTVPAEGTQTLVVEQQADSLTESPELVWRDLSTSAVLTVAATPTDPVLSHGPKVIPPGESYETAKYGDRPFPVVPVAYNDREYQTTHERDLDTVINDPEFEGSTYNLYQEMSLGQLYPHGTVPSTGVPTAGFAETGAEFDFTPRELPGDTCTGGLTFADSPVPVQDTPAYPERIQDGVYQLPGNTAFYGADSGGTAIAGPGSIDSGCGGPGKLVRDAAIIADPEIDYSDYDTDKDGIVDFFMAVFAGCGGNGASQLTVLGCPYTDAPYDNVWPHSSSLEFYYEDPVTHLPGYTTDDQLKDLEGRPLWYTDDTYSETTTTDTGDALKVFVRVGPYNVNPETAIDKASVISHEYGHSLGLPDFYSSDSRETYGDWNLMATDKSQNMDVFSRQELGWIVPQVLEPGSMQDVDGWTDSREDTDTIEWQRPDGTPYTLTEGDDGRVQNSQAYVAKLPGRQLLDPAVFDSGATASRTHAWWSQSGNDFGCAPTGGHNLDFAIPELATADPGSEVTLELKSLWDIEWDFDYGYVLTTTDQGETYTSHASDAGFTTSNTDPLAGNPNANACQTKYDNGITGTSGSYDAGTEVTDRKTEGYPDAVFVADSYDISDLAGAANGALRFSYATDPGLARPGWFIDDLTVTLTEPGEEPREVLVTDLETSGGPDDERVYNGGCRTDLSTAQQCTPGWAFVAAGAETPADHAYYLELRDRSGFDLDGQDQIDRDPIAFGAGLSLVYTDEAHGYGNNGVPNPPAQSPLDSTPDPGNEAPDLSDAAFTAAPDRSTYSDAGEGHTDNYTDPGNSSVDPSYPDVANPWRFRYDCLGFAVTSMTGTEEGPDTSDGDLTGDVSFDMGDGCGAFDYGYEPDEPGPNTAPTAAASASPTSVAVGEDVELSAADSDDAETPGDLDYSWDFGNGGTRKDAVGEVVRTSYGQAGTKHVTLTVTDPLGETDSATVDVTVAARPTSNRHVNFQSGAVDRTGSWRTVRDDRADDGNYCDNLGQGSGTDGATYSFTSPRLELLHGRSQRGGALKVWIDGERQPNLSLRGDTNRVSLNGRKVYSGLGDGRHTIRIEVARGEAYIEGFVIRR